MDEHEHTGADEPATKPNQDEVAKKAYAIYLKEGRPQGHAEQNWLEAEAEMAHAGYGHPDHHEDHAHMAADFRKRLAPLPRRLPQRRDARVRGRTRTVSLAAFAPRESDRRGAP